MKLQHDRHNPRFVITLLTPRTSNLRYLASESTPSRRRPFLPFIPEKKNIKNKLVLSKDLRPCFVQPLSRAAWPRHHSFSLLHGSAVGPVTANPWEDVLYINGSVLSAMTGFQIDFSTIAIVFCLNVFAKYEFQGIIYDQLPPFEHLDSLAISTKGFQAREGWVKGSRNPHVNQLLFTIYGNKRIYMHRYVAYTNMYTWTGWTKTTTHTFFITQIQSSTVSHKHDAKKMKNIILLIELTIRSLFPYVYIYIYTHDPFIYLSFIGLW